MRPLPAPVSLAPDAPFRYVGGDPSLDFVNTATWTDRGVLRERLTDYARLVEWAEGAAVIDAAAAARLLQRARRRPADAESALDGARRARRVLQRLFVAHVEGARPAAVLADFDALLADAHVHLALAWPDGAAGDPLRWRWRGADAEPGSILWPVARAAATLLTSDEASRIRLCGGDDCGWLFVDRSRNGLRRWCEMEECGTREKSRRRAERAGSGR